MAIKNYTSKISTIKSLAEIQEDLAIHGARKIMIEYGNGLLEIFKLYVMDVEQKAVIL